MRSVVHRVNERQGTGRVCQLYHLTDLVDRSNSVSGPSHRNQTRVAPDLGGQIEHIEGAITGLYVGGAYLHAALLQRNPRRDIGVVVKAGYQQLFTALKLAPNGPAEGKGESRHVRAKYDLVVRAIEKIRHGSVRIGNHLVGAAAG